MWPQPPKITVKFKKPENELPHEPSFLGQGSSNLQEILDVSSSSSLSSDDENGQSSEDAFKQMVLYDPAPNNTGAIVAVPEPDPCQPRKFRRYFGPSNQRVLPSVGAFTVQCATCFKWRLIPTKEKYEEIREHIIEQPFSCETAREWRPDISCDDPADIVQDGSRLWAIDKPSIARPPPGWQRLLRIRSEGSTKFADVYYAAPSGRRLRSMVEVQKYLLEHPEYTRDGVTLSQFSFQIPKPLQDNYVRKRPARLPVSSDDDNGRLRPSFVNPLAWASPDGSTGLHLGMPRRLPPSIFDHVHDRPAKKQATHISPIDINSNDPNVSPGPQFLK
ncbi:methyl-CpG-binding domain-containing protein 2 [Humulus lupulus]|uniref:methyl-CpG-binding domain-containing protein 2 n=1 Tax=Humulus lupulus TaxID=3486 RepID=UPI002B415FA4|nr:methyl-CpG-binding domain-containing protein 2 [Humulus lupulus]XP_062115306.1 methyl-CpG-binding domain-containing protein 2 [Humulus lupulus]